MTTKNYTQLSKLLSKILRHKPESFGIELDASGWTDVDLLIEKIQKRGYTLTKEILRIIVAQNDKKRFSFNADESLIRANQGHSVSVELGLPALRPPEVLYHGTVERHLNSIFSLGLQKQQRHHVHLSANTKTAYTVAKRYGVPVLLEVDARQMHEDGILFYCSENGVWLVDEVLPQYLTRQ